MRNALIGASVLAALAILIDGGQAKAQNTNGQYDDSKYAAWFGQQYNSHGGWCCNLADGHRYDGAYSINPDGTVTLQGNPNIIIDAYKVLDGMTTVIDGATRGGPNPTGHAVVWFSGDQPNADGLNIYCFSPGSLD